MRYPKPLSGRRLGSSKNRFTTMTVTAWVLAREGRASEVNLDSSRPEIVDITLLKVASGPLVDDLIYKTLVRRDKRLTE